MVVSRRNTPSVTTVEGLALAAPSRFYIAEYDSSFPFFPHRPSSVWRLAADGPLRLSAVPLRLVLPVVVLWCPTSVRQGAGLRNYALRRYNVALSGLYSLWSAIVAPATPGGSLMAAIGVVVPCTRPFCYPYADWLGGTGGPC